MLSAVYYGTYNAELGKILQHWSYPREWLLKNTIPEMLSQFRLAEYSPKIMSALLVLY